MISLHHGFMHASYRQLEYLTSIISGEIFRTVSMAISHKFRKHPESVKKHYCPHCGMMFPIKVQYQYNVPN